MTEREDREAKSEDEVVIEHGRFTGCRGRVLIVLLVLAVMITLLLAMLVRGMFSGTAPLPVKRAALESAEVEAA